MARNVELGLTVSYRGRRSFQALRQDTLKTAQSMAMLSSASIRASHQIGNSFDAAGQRIARFAQISAVIFGGLLIREFFATATAYEKSMSSVLAITDATAKEFGVLSKQAKELGATTVFTASQSAEAMEVLALAGFEVNEIYAVMPSVLDFAAAAQLDVAEAASFAADTLRIAGFHALEFEHAADIMAKAATESNQKIRDLARAFTFVGPVAHAAGVSFQETNAALAVLANAGLRAERGGTSLRRILTVLIGDLDKGTRGVKGLGLQLKDTNGKLIGIEHSFKQLNKAGVGLVDMMIAFGQRGGPAALVLASMSDEIGRMNKLLESSEGTMERIARTRLDNLIGKFTLLKSAFSGLSIEVFERLEPTLSKIVEGITGMLQRSQDMERINDVFEAIMRTVRALAVLIGGLLVRSVILGFAKMVVAMKAANAQLTMQVVKAKQAASGYIALGTTGQFAVNRLTGSLILANAQLRKVQMRVALMRAGWIGMGALVAFEIGTIIIKLLGLEDAISKTFERGFNPGLVESQTQSLSQMVNMIETAQKRFGDLGIDSLEGLNFQQIHTQFNLLESGMARWADAAEGELDKVRSPIKKAAEELSGMMEVVRRAGTTPELTALWNAAAEGADSLHEQVKAYMIAEAQLLKQRQDGIANSVKRNEELFKLMKAGSEDAFKALFEDGVLTEKKLEDVTARFAGIIQVIRDIPEGKEAFAKMFPEEVIALSRALEGSTLAVDENLKTLLNDLLKLVAGYQAFEDDQEKMNKSMESFEQHLEKAGLATTKMATEQLGELERALELSNVQFGNSDAFVEAYAEDIVALADALRATGQELPPLIKEFEGLALGAIEFQESRDDMLKQLTEIENEIRNITDSVANMWTDFGEHATSVMADAVAGIILDGEKAGDVFKDVFKGLVRSMIQMLVQWGFQRLALARLNTKATALEASAQHAAGMGAVYTQSFASAAAIPIVGWALAPGIAAANVAIATAGSTAAAAVGAGLGAGFAMLAEGGIVTRPTMALIGEAGPEAVIPLRGLNGRRAAEAGFGGGGTTVVAPTINIYGDNWQENGISSELTEEIHTGLREMINNGSLGALPDGVR